MKAKATSKSVQYLRIPFHPDKPKVISKSKGKKTGMGLYEFLVAVFESNENSRKKMTDESIKKAVVKEFGHLKSVKRLADGQVTIGYYRSLYNFHGLVGLPHKPKRRSYRYTSEGEVANPKTGRPMHSNGRSQ